MGFVGTDLKNGVRSFVSFVNMILGVDQVLLLGLRFTTRIFISMLFWILVDVEENRSMNLEFRIYTLEWLFLIDLHFDFFHLWTRISF